MQTIVKVFAKSPRLNLIAQAAMSGGDQSQIHMAIFPATYPVKSLLFNEAQELC